MVLFSFTSSYHCYQEAYDGNATLYQTIKPFDDNEWSKIFKHFQDKLTTVNKSDDYVIMLAAYLGNSCITLKIEELVTEKG